MRTLWLLAIGFCGSVAHAATPAPTGRWLTANHAAVIQIAPCGGDLCGRIVGIALSHMGDPMPADWQGHPQCGETILHISATTDAAGETKWSGTVLDPRNGDVYQANIAVNPDGTLRLHGYLLLPLLGQTQIWQPYQGQIAVGCGLG